MANKFQVKRTTVSGRTPNTTNSGNTHFIDTGELALNLTDGKMFSSNGSVYFEVGANLTNLSVAANVVAANIYASGTVSHTLTGTTTTGEAQIYLNGATLNRIDFNTNGVAAPAFTTRSSGTKIALYPALGASSVDYALGIDAGALWTSIPGNDAGQFFKWYGGETQVGSLSGTGMMNIIGAVNAASHTVGSNFIANTTAVVITTPITANGSTGTAGQVLTSNGSTGAPYWATGGGGGGGGRTVTSTSGDGSTTSFNVTYEVGYVDVYLNGVKLILGTDFTATNGTTVVFTVAPMSGDSIEFVSFTTTPLTSGAARTITSYTSDGVTSTYSLTYDIGFVDVYVNGVKYSSGTDYTASDGANITFNAIPLSGDNIEFVAFRNTFSINDAVAKSGDTMTGALVTPAVNVGTSKLIANTTAVLIAAPLNANGGTGTSGQILVSNGTTGSPYWATSNSVAKSGDTMTGTLIAPAINIGSSSLIANTTAIVVAAPLTANGGTGSTGHVLYSNGVSGSPYWAVSPSVMNLTDDTSTNGDRYLIFANQTTGVITSSYVSSTKMYFNPSTGKLNATSFNSLSDESTKENIQTLNDAVSKVMSMRGVSFTWKDTSEKSIGVIAQEVEKIIPEVVSTGKDGIKSVSYDSIVGLLIEAIKEQQSTINELKEKIQLLLNKDKN